MLTLICIYIYPIGEKISSPTEGGTRKSQVDRCRFLFLFGPSVQKLEPAEVNPPLEEGTPAGKERGQGCSFQRTSRERRLVTGASHFQSQNRHNMPRNAVKRSKTGTKFLRARGLDHGRSVDMGPDCYILMRPLAVRDAIRNTITAVWSHLLCSQPGACPGHGGFSPSYVPDVGLDRASSILEGVLEGGAFKIALLVSLTIYTLQYMSSIDSSPLGAPRPHSLSDEPTPTRGHAATSGL